MPRWAWRCVHIGLAVVATVAAVVAVALTARARALYGEPDYSSTHMLGLPVAFGWAGAVLMRYPKARYLARILLAAALASGLGTLAGALGVSRLTENDALLRALWLLESVGLMGSLLLAMALLPQAFPDGPLQVRPWPRIFRCTLWTVIAVPVVQGAAYQIGTLFSPAFDGVGEALWVTSAVMVAVGVFLGAASLLVRWRTTPAPERGQLTLYAAINVAAAAAILVFVVFEDRLPYRYGDWFLVLWPMAVVAVIIVAALRSQLYDVRVVVKRTVINATLAVVVAVVFVGVYFTALFLVSERLDQPEYRWIALAMAALSAVMLEPLRRRIRRGLERRLLGDRSDPLTALDRLHERITQSDETAIFTGVVETVAAAVRSPQVALTLQRGSGTEQVAAVGEPAAEPVLVPLIYLGERLGQLRVSPRTEGETFGRADCQLLDQLARQTAALVYAKRRDLELAGARRQTVDAVVEERSRLGRDLHDGLAPLLAGAGLSAEALRRSLTPGSSDEDDAARLAALLRRTASDARRMAHDLQPAEPYVDMASALTDYLASLKGTGMPVFTVAIDVVDLPSSVAQSAYLVLLEATTNVVRHAQASDARVSAAIDADHLQLEVVDDGVGLDQPYVSGVGISSMRRRVESLGGRFTIGREPGHGTRLSASIPLHVSD